MTRLDSCCKPPSSGTPNSFVVSDSFITLNLKAELEQPDEFIVKLANGKLCVNEIGCATLKRYSVDVTLCNADPDLFEIMGGVTKVLDFNGDIVGYEIDQALGQCGKFSMEFWTRVPQSECLSDNGLTQYVYWLLPCLKNGRVGDVSIANGPLEFSFAADAIPSSSWGVGPFDTVAQDVDNTPGPLLASIGCQTALHVQTTTIAPPCESDTTCVSGTTEDLNCGAQTMV